MIGETVKIEGEITGAENLVIRGSVKGSVNLPSHEVTVDETGKVEAGIKGKIVVINGEVTGDISGGEKVVISKSGNVRGNIIAPRVTLEDGAVFKGSIDMDPGASASTSKKPTPAYQPESAASDTPNLDVKSG